MEEKVTIQNRIRLDGYCVTFPSKTGRPFTQIDLEGNNGLELSKTNQNKAHCKECTMEIFAGEAIYHRFYYRNGYICLACAKELILTIGIYGNKDYGFFEDIFGNLKRCTYTHVISFTSKQVCGAIELVQPKDGKDDSR